MKKLLFCLLVIPSILWGQLDPYKNNAVVQVKYGYNSTATSITLKEGHGSYLPNPATDGYFNMAWWDAYGYPYSWRIDPNYEIVRVTARNGDVLTVTRAQEGTTARDHQTHGRTYKMILDLTKKTFDDLESAISVVQSADSAYYAQYADTAEFARNAESGQSDTAQYAITAGSAAYAINSESAITAVSASSATYAASAGSATTATTATTAGSATTATTATNATNATYATTAGSATTATTATSASTATYATTAGAAPPIGTASGHLKDQYPSPSIADNVIDADMIKTGEVVKSIFGLRDDVAMKGSGGTSLSIIDGGANPDTLVVASIDTAGGGGGISTIGSNGTISVQNPSGPVATIDVANSGITTAQLASGSVETSDILNGTILTEDFNVTAVIPQATYANTAGGAPPTGSAGGGLTGTYPNPTLAANSVGASQITDGTVGTAEIADGTVSSTDIANGTIATADFNAGAVAPSATYATTAGGAPPTGSASGGLTGTYPSPTLASNSVGSSQIIDGAIVQGDLHPDLTVTATLIPNRVLYALESGGDTNIASTNTPISMLDSTQALYFPSNYKVQDASLLTRGSLSNDRLTNSGVSAGTYNWGTVNSKGIVTSAQNVSGVGGGGGGGLSNVVVDSFTTTATKDTVTISGAKSYDWYSATAMMKAPDEAWSANDGLRVYADSGRAIVSRNTTGTSGAWYSLGRQAKELAMPSNVDVTSLSSTSLRVTWTDPVHSESFSAFTTDSIGISYRTAQYDSVFSTATNKRYKDMGVQADTITGLSASTLYYVSVFPWTTHNESDTALSGNRDTCTTSEGGGEAFFNAKDSLGSLQLWTSVRFLGAKNNLDVIETTELKDSSGNNRTFTYGTHTNAQKARYLSDQVNGIGAIAHYYRDSGDVMDTCVITCDAVASYLSANNENKPYTVVIVGRLVQPGNNGYGDNQDLWGGDLNTASNFQEGRLKWDTHVMRYVRMTQSSEHLIDQSITAGQERQWHIWTWKFDGDNISMYRDSTLLGTASAINYDNCTADLFSIGGLRVSTGASGVMYKSSLRWTECLVMSKAASDYEFSYYIKWLKSIYAIQ